MSESTSVPGQIIERRELGALIITLARPEHANSYTDSMLRELSDAIDRADRDESLRVIVVTGAGERAFCAGADRAEIERRSWRSVPDLLAARTFAKLQRSQCVSVAAINGAAVGGGFELALHCDIRIASVSSTFWLPEPELSLLPAAGGLRLLPGIVGLLRSKDLILGGARWTADEALRSGLVSETATPELLWSAVSTWIQRIHKRDPLAMRWAKALLADRAGTVDQGVDRLAQSMLMMAKRRDVNGGLVAPTSSHRRAAGPERSNR